MAIDNRIPISIISYDNKSLEFDVQSNYVVQGGFATISNITVKINSNTVFTGQGTGKKTVSFDPILESGKYDVEIKCVGQTDVTSILNDTIWIDPSPIETLSVISTLDQVAAKSIEIQNFIEHQKNKLAFNLKEKKVSINVDDSLSDLVKKTEEIDIGSKVLLNGARINYDFNISDGKWTSLSTLPYSMIDGSTVVYNNEIHIIGGNGNTTRHYKWNGSAWVSVSTLPYNFYSGSVVVYKNEIHILGSYYGSSCYTNHYKWNGSTWTQVSILPYRFYRGSVVVYNNEIHILGSYNSSCRKMHYKWNGSAWVSVSTLPYDFYSGGAVVYNNEIHIFCDEDHLKWNGSAWEPVSIVPFKVSGSSVVVFNNEIHIIGSSYSAYCEMHYKWNGSIWDSVSIVPHAFSNGSGVVHNNKIHMLGGNISTTNRTQHQYYEKLPDGTYCLNTVN